MSLQFNGTNGITYNDGTLQSTAYTGSGSGGGSGGGDGGDYTPEPMVWENKKAERGFDTLYTNTNDVPLYVQIYSYTSGSLDTENWYFEIDGVNFGYNGVNTVGSINQTPMFIIPAGSTYKAVIGGGIPVISKWNEARMPVAVGTGGGSGGDAQPPVAFSLKLSSQVDGDFPQLTDTDLIFDNVELDTDNGSNGTGYVIQKSGIYSLNARVRFNGKNPNNLITSRIFIKKGSIGLAESWNTFQGTDSSGTGVYSLQDTPTATTTVQLEKDDVITVQGYIQTKDGANAYISDGALTQFSGHMISSITEGEVVEKEAVVFRAKPDTTVLIPQATVTKINLNEAVIDTTNALIDGKFKPSVAGYYHFEGMIGTSNNGNRVTTAYVYKNGVIDCFGTNVSSDEAQGSKRSISTGVIYLDGKEDYLEIYAYVDGASATREISTPSTYLSAHLITGQSSGGSGGGDAYTKEESDAIDNAQDVKIVINNDDIARQQIEITNNTAEIGKNTSAINTNIINIAQNSEDIAELQDSIFFSSAYSANYPSAANRDPEDGNMYLQAFALFTYSYASATQIFCSKTDEAGNVRQFTAIKAGDSVVLNEVDSPNYGRYELVSIEEVSESYVVMNVIPKLGEGTIVAGVKVAFQAFPKVGIWTNIDGVATYDGDIKVNGVTVGRGSGDFTSNTSVGTSSLLDNISGNLNSAFGGGSLQKNTTGIQNTAIGYASLQKNEYGVKNTAVGFSALSSTQYKDNCTAVGNNALKSNLQSGNTAVGSAALDEVILGSANTAIGAGAGQKVELGTNNTLIGADAQPSAAGVSNEVTIGNDDVTSTRLKGKLEVTGKSGATFTKEITNNVGHDIKQVSLKTSGDTNSVFSSLSSAFYNSAGETPTYTQIRSGITDSTKGNEESSIIFFIMNNGTLTETMTVGTGNVTISNKLKVPNAYTDTNTRAPNLTMGSDGNIQRSTTLTYSTQEVDEKLAIKDKLIEKLSARLTKLEKRIK